MKYLKWEIKATPDRKIERRLDTHRMKINQCAAGGRREDRREPAFSDRGDRGGDRGDRPRRRRN